MAALSNDDKGSELMKIERESVIMTMKARLLVGLLELIDNESDRDEFARLCKRVDSTIRAWYQKEFEELMQLYDMFDPVFGAKRLEQQRLSPARVDDLEQTFLRYLFKVFEKSNYKLVSDEEVEIAKSGQYLLNLPIDVDKSKLDGKLFGRYFSENPMDDLPEFANQYVIFRQGIDVDRTSGYFFTEKVDAMISHIWHFFLRKLRLKKPTKSKQLSRGRCSIVSRSVDNGPNATEIVDPTGNGGVDGNQDIFVKRIRIENMNMSLKNFFGNVTIQEPTFERMIVVYRRATPKNDTSKYGDRGIHIKQFRHIPMADMELVLPEKKTPGLTPMDWTKLLVSAVLGLVTLVTSLEMPKADFWVVSAILGAVLGYCAKIFFSFQQSVIQYQNLMTKSMYDKQLDSGRGTLLHMCDDVIQQEVKEVMLAYFILMSQGRSTKEDLDFQCEKLMLEEFGETFDFEVEDAIQKMERLGIVTRDSLGRYGHAVLKRANEILGISTEEKLSKLI